MSKRGEQYTGWRAIEAGNGNRHFNSADEALRWMQAQDDLEGGQLAPGALYRKLARRFHPDVPTGSQSEWNQLDSARQLLEAACLL